MQKSSTLSSQTSRAEPGGSSRESGGGASLGSSTRDGGWAGGSSSSSSKSGGGTSKGHESQAARNGFPIVLDLDRDGTIELAHKSAGAFFDMDNDGIRDATAWAGRDDALLVIDLAKGGAAGPDGVIDQSSEVVFTNWVAGSMSDMAAVKAVFDSNGNGKLDAGDARFAEFRVWQDGNGDGISGSSALETIYVVNRECVLNCRVRRPRKAARAKSSHALSPTSTPITTRMDGW